MKQRIITGSICGILFIGCLFLMDTVFFALVLSLMSAIAVHEVEKAVSLKNIPIMILSLALSVAIPILVHFNIEIPVAAVGGFYVVLIFILMLIQFEKTKFEEAVTAIFASVAIEAWSVPGSHKVSKPCIRLKRIRISCKVLSSAWPM